MPGLLRELRQHVGPNRPPELRRRDLLVGTVIDPGFSRFAFAALLEFIQQLAEAAAEQAACAGAAQHPAEIAKHSAQRVAGTRLRLAASRVTKHFSELV